jgi:adenine-specific DNA-methyltransferase
VSTRAEAFEAAKAALSAQARLVSDEAIVCQGDSLELLRRMPAGCVSLVLTDPPYHSTKKANIYGDKDFEQDQHFVDWMQQYAVEWRRVLRPNGSLFMFCSSAMAARLEVMLASTYNILSSIVWTKPNEPGYDGWKGKMNKEALRQFYPHSERVIFAEPAVEGNLHRSPFAQYLREIRKQCGLSGHELTEKIGAYGAVNHGGAVSNWETGRNIPSREQYEKMCHAFIGTGKVSSMPPYEDVIRIFRMDGSKQFTDVWDFYSVRPYKGKHPAEKPNDMLVHMIEATTFPGDLVLDCFCGSGSTALAALSLGRRAIAMDIEEEWASQAAARVATVGRITEPVPSATVTKRAVKAQPDLPLFEQAGG